MKRLRWLATASTWLLLQLNPVPLQRAADGALELRDRLVQIRARAQFQGLRGDVRGLSFEDQKHRAQPGIEAAAFALVLLERVAALRGRGVEALLRRAHGLHRVAHFAFNHLLELLALPFELCPGDFRARQIRPRRPVAQRQIHLQLYERGRKAVREQVAE